MLLELTHSPWHEFTSNFGFYSLTFGPFLYLYISKITNEGARFLSKDLIHFLPYASFSLVHLFFYTDKQLVAESIDEDPGWFILNISRIVVLTLSMIIYSIASLRELRKHSIRTKDSFSTRTSSITLSWLRHIIFVILFTYFLLIINMLLGNVAKLAFDSSHIIPAIGLTFFCFSLSYFGFSQPVLYSSSTSNEEETKSEDKLSSSQTRSYTQKLESYMVAEKPYLNPELTINELADEVKIPRHYITNILKSELNVNFFTLVNNYRLQEVKEKLRDPAYQKCPVLQIAMECGFNSKSSFNAIFKQNTGQTPSDYRKLRIKENQVNA